MKNLERLLCLLALLLVFLYSTAFVEADFDAIAVVERVIDGDTIVVTIVESRTSKISPGSIERVRLADINAPELKTPQGESAKLYLERLLSKGTIVYLDVDDIELRDKYGRLVAIVYFKVNDTCILNVNYHLVLLRYATIWDHFNEFDPKTWKECLETTSEQRELYRKDLINLAIIALVLVSAVTITIIIASNKRKIGTLFH
ncbi:MAG: thermonuclease family protein [Acidilobaceae archaeon]